MSDETYTVLCDNILHKTATVELSGEEHVVHFEKDKQRGVAVATGVPAPVASSLAEADAYTIDGSDGSGDGEPGGQTPSTIEGIGPTYEETLEDAGIDTVGDLADADAETLAEEVDISEEQASTWIGAAKAHG